MEKLFSVCVTSINASFADKTIDKCPKAGKEQDCPVHTAASFKFDTVQPMSNAINKMTLSTKQINEKDFLGEAAALTGVV